MHPRALIRQAFKARLGTAAEGGAFPTDAQARVETSRIAPVGDDDELPAILIYSRDEKIDPEKGWSPEGEDAWNERELHVVVEAIVRGGETVDDKLDAIAEQIEAAILDWQIPGFESARIRLIETEYDLVTEGVRKPLGAGGLVFVVRYRAPWRIRPPGTRPDTVSLAIFGDASLDHIITHDKGLRNP